MTTPNRKNGSSNNKDEGHGVAIGVGLAALAAAAAGAYYLYGSDKGPERRRKLKSWSLRMKADVLEQIEQLKEVNEEAYQKIVEGISEKYKQLKDVDPLEVAALATRMRGHWKDIQKDLKGAASGIKKSASKTSSKMRTVRARKPNTSSKK